MTTKTLPANSSDAYDYVIVGGGTAGCVLASRLSSYLPERKVLLIEAGPSDFDLSNVLDLRQWLTLLGGELDYDYGTTEQPMGNSHIRHSRAKVLGGCSSHNTLISFRPFRHDLERWVAKGCKGWDFDTLVRLVDNLRNTFQPVHARHRNQLCKDWVESCSTALDIPVIQNFNDEIRSTGQLTQGAGFFNISYNPDNGYRSSASVAYIHPILRGEERRPNLTVLTEAHVSKLFVENDEAKGVAVTLASGQKVTIRARKETILSAGALEGLGIKVVKDIPGVGENLIDHPETIIMWELNQPVPPNQTTMDSDAGVFFRREPTNAAGNDGDAADVMMHCYQIPFCLNTERLGYPPALDFRYFTDPEGYDAATLVAGIRAARKIAEQEPFKGWLKQEVAPGPKVQTDEEISEYARRVAHTVYHPAGTTKMGDVTRDEYAVVDPELKVRGIKKLRIADAGIFPEMVSINPMLTVLAIGERAAELIAMEDGWKVGNKPARL
ncbi:hypothetical protein ACCO45_004414 [Purpureocillium lilacinum]|uniref:Uncharacterized protein n=1 Tax=Purpureocillium lilacinum TaxID=33203 RepID=A0ACC4E5H3_PURLI